MNMCNLPENLVLLGTTLPTYPLLMALVGLITVVVLLTFVMPRVVGIFEDLGQQLPIITLVLLEISRFIREYWYIAVSVIIFLLFLI